MPGHIVLEGNRVSLYTITKEDLKAIWELLEDKDIIFQIFSPDLVFYFENLEEFYNNLINSKKDIWFLIVEKNSKKVVGMIGINIKEEIVRRGELNYFIGRGYRNRGYATEAVRLMLYYAFNYLNLEKVYAEVDENNIASKRVLEKNGFKLVGKLRKHEYNPREKYINSLLYDILREEFAYIKNSS